MLDAEKKPLCTLRRKWTSGEFKFGRDGIEFAKVSKKSAGMGKELYTSADNYILEIDKNVPHDDSIRRLILATVMCIDMVLKEK